MTTAPQSLPDFLLAMIAADEAVAKAAVEASGESGSWWVDGPAEKSGKFWVYAAGEKFSHEPIAQHIARHDPARILAQCAAYRAIVDRYDGCDDCGAGDHPCLALRALGSIWSAHPDFDKAWAS